MKINKDFAAIHAYLCGDGCVITNPPGKQKYYIIDFRNTEIKLLLDFQEKFERVFGERPIINRDKDRCKKGSRKVYEFLIENYGSFHSWKWKMPDLDGNCAAAWLRAFFDCEGWVVNIPGKDRTIALECVNQPGLLQIQQALHKLGIATKIRRKTRRNIWLLGIYGRKNIVQYQNKIGFLHPKKKQKLEEAILSYDLWRWHFPERKTLRERFTRRMLKQKIRKKKHVLRVFSRKENLLKLAQALKELHDIDAKVNERINGSGTHYHELNIYGQAQIRRIEEIL